MEQWQLQGRMYFVVNDLLPFFKKYATKKSHWDLTDMMCPMSKRLITSVLCTILRKEAERRPKELGWDVLSVTLRPAAHSESLNIAYARWHHRGGSTGAQRVYLVTSADPPFDMLSRTLASHPMFPKAKANSWITSARQRSLDIQRCVQAP